jgi:hypothetical protein
MKSKYGILLSRKLLLLVIIYIIFRYIFGVISNTIKESYDNTNKHLIYSDESKFQTIKLFQNEDCFWLNLNDEIQFHSNEYLKSHYIQCDIPIKMYQPRNVLILGGGDGIAASIVLKYPCVKSVTMVEIDEKMINMLKNSKLMRKITNNVIDNPKLNIIIQNAVNYVYQNNEKFDMIIEDIEHDHTSQSTDYDDDDYFLKLLTMSNVVSLTYSDEYDDDIDKDYPIFYNNYIKQQYNKMPSFSKYCGNKVKLFKELEFDEPFLKQIRENKILNDVKLFICAHDFKEPFGFERYLLAVN